MPAALEIELVLVFAALLAFAAILLGFLPILRHVWFYSVSRRMFAAVLAVVLGLAVAAVVLVYVAVADPAYFLPIVAVTVGLRIASPALVYARVRDRFDTTRSWSVVRAVVGLGFLVLAGILAYDVALLASGGEPAGIATVSEQLVMALSASVLIVRMAARERPRESKEWWPVWSAAVLFAVAFVVVLPYAVPVFAIIYAASGLAGWLVAFAILLWDR